MAGNSNTAVVICATEQWIRKKLKLETTVLGTVMNVT